jgi:hypothetical protein
VRRRNFFKNQSARQYKRKRFHNPYFRYRSAISRRLVIAAMMAFLLPIILLAWLFTAPRWRLTDVKVIGLTTISLEQVTNLVKEDMTGKRFLIFPKNHRLFVQDDLIALHIQQEFGFSEVSVQIRKDQFLLEVEEPVSEVVYIHEGNGSVLSLDGAIIRGLTIEERAEVMQRSGVTIAEALQEEDARILQPNAPIISVTSGDVTHDNVLYPIDPSFFVTLDEALRDRLITPTYYEIESSQLNWVRVKTTQGIDLLIDGLDDVESQMQVLDIVLHDYGEDLSNSSYIDLRFGNRVYVK